MIFAWSEPTDVFFTVNILCFAITQKYALQLSDQLNFVVRGTGNRIRRYCTQCATKVVRSIASRLHLRSFVSYHTVLV